MVGLGTGTATLCLCCSIEPGFTHAQEEPFGILPLENLCDTLQRNVKGMLEEEQRIKVGRPWVGRA